MKKVSIITPTLNDGKMLRKTLESVLRQNYPNIEHVVADGGSLDDSLEVLKEYEKKYTEAGKKLIWISEKDRGIFDGVNKAVALSSGDLIIHMENIFTNNDILSMMVNQLELTDSDYIFGGLIYHKNGLIIRRWSGKPGNWKFGFMMATPTLLYTRAVWERHGPYSGEYIASNGKDLAADYDFQIKLMSDLNLKFVAIQKPLVIYYAGGTTNANFKSRWLGIKECQKVLKNNHAPFPTLTNICKTGIALCAYIFALKKKVELEEWM